MLDIKRKLRVRFTYAPLLGKVAGTLRKNVSTPVASRQVNG